MVEETDDRLTESGQRVYSVPEMANHSPTDSQEAQISGSDGQHIRTRGSGLARALVNRTPQVAMTHHLKPAALMTNTECCKRRKIKN